MPAGIPHGRYSVQAPRWACGRPDCARGTGSLTIPSLVRIHAPDRSNRSAFGSIDLCSPTTVRAGSREPSGWRDIATRTGRNTVLEPLRFASLAVQELRFPDDSVGVHGQMPPNVGCVPDYNVSDGVPNTSLAGVFGDLDCLKLTDRENPRDNCPHRIGRTEPGVRYRPVRCFERDLSVPAVTAVPNTRLDVDIALRDIGVSVVNVESEPSPRRARFVLVVSVRSGTESLEGNP